MQHSNSQKKEGKITNAEKANAAKQVQNILKEIKDTKGDVVIVAINDRTSIELSASLSQEEIDERVANYIRLHKKI